MCALFALSQPYSKMGLHGLDVTGKMGTIDRAKNIPKVSNMRSFTWLLLRTKKKKNFPNWCLWCVHTMKCVSTNLGTFFVTVIQCFRMTCMIYRYHITVNKEKIRRRKKSYNCYHTRPFLPDLTHIICFVGINKCMQL